MKIYLRKETKEILARRNWTYEDFGFKIGCDGSYACKLLNADKEVSPRRREAIMRVLKEYEFDDLFIIEDGNGQQTD